MTVSIWQEQVEPVSEVSHDVAIIGCGLVGSYAASLLTAAGRDVAIIEARFPAAGASGRNAGFVHLGVRHLYSEAIDIFGHDVARDVWNLTVDNVRRMRRFAKDFGVEHEEKGAAFVSTDEAKSAEMRKSVKLAQRDGFQVEYLDRDPFERGFKAAIVHPSDFAIHPARLTNAMVSSSGATLYQNDEMAAITRDGVGLVVRTRQRLVRCGKVLLAVNGYAGRVHPFFRRLVEPARGEVLLTEPAPKVVSSIGTVLGRFYFQQFPDGRLLVGGGRYRFMKLSRTYSDETTPQVQSLIRSFVARRFPDVELNVSRRWAGIHGMTNDGLPIVGRLPDEPEVYFAVGFSGYGHSLGLVAGDRAVDLMLNGLNPGVLSVNRLR